tara:strand:- start:795 stop:1121 length:327 start_codon:yes stop_codon:yes gene_type:complete
LEQIAFGELNMSTDELYNMTPRNFLNAQLGQARLFEMQQQADWERARWMSCVIINPHLKRVISPNKITVFPWEKAEKKKTQADINKILKESQYQDKVEELKKRKRKNA